MMAETLQKYTERELVNALQSRQAGAFPEMVRRYSDRIYRLALRYTKSPEDAEELLQEVLLIVFRKIDTFQNKSALSTWIYSITSNTALTFLKKKSHRPATAMEDAGLNDDRLDAIMRHGQADWPDDIKDPLLRSELNSVLEKAIHSLPVEYKMIFIWKEIEKRSIKEITELMDPAVSEGAIKTRLHRARLLLRSALRDYFSEYA